MDSAAPEARLDRLVREHRVTIAVVFPTVGAALLVASDAGLLPAVLAFHPLLLLAGTAAMRVPLLGALAPLVDRRAALWLGLLVAYTYGIELVGLATGWPYGEFAYGIALGPMVGGVPAALPLFFVPLVANAYLLSLVLTGGSRLTVPVAVGFVLGIDLVLDPAAVALGFWAYPGGVYYDVPLSNFAGWVLSGTVGVFAVDRAFDRTALGDRLAAIDFALDDFVSFVLLWGLVNWWYGQWLALLVAGGLGVALVSTGRVGSPPLGMRRWTRSRRTR